MARLNTQLCSSGTITDNVAVSVLLPVCQQKKKSTFLLFSVTSDLHVFQIFPKCAYSTFLLSVQLSCTGPQCQPMYLGIFETEMTHVVIDQTEGKAPVHERQAPLRREERWL